MGVQVLRARFGRARRDSREVFQKLSKSAIFVVALKTADEVPRFQTEITTESPPPPLATITMVDFNIARDKSERDERATTGKRRSIFNPRTKIGIEDREEERYEQRKVKQNGKNSRTIQRVKEWKKKRKE